MSERSARRLERQVENQQARLEDRFEDTVDTVVDAAKNVRQWAAPRVEAGIKAVAPRVEKGIAYAAPRIQDAMDRSAPMIDAAGHRLTDEYLPRLSERVGSAAASAGVALSKINTPESLENIAAALTGDHGNVEKVRKALAKASHELEKNTRRRSGKGKWVWFTLIAGGIAAAIVIWRKSQPAEDPWSTPLSSRPADARPVSNPVTAVKEAAAEVADDVADTAKDAADTMKDAAEDVVEEATETAKKAGDTAAKTAKKVTPPKADNA
jgi:ElaB/YqjD/DUF883 family membrane-anchored ribosome-binding protein